MEQERVTTLVRAFSTTRRSEIDAAWTVAESMGDDLLMLLAEAFPQVRKAEGRASILRYVGRFSERMTLPFGWESLPSKIVPMQCVIMGAQFLHIRSAQMQFQRFLLC